MRLPFSGKSLFCDLLTEAGKPTIITRHGRPVAAIVPVDVLKAARRQLPLLPLAGTGRGLWGGNSSNTISALKDEWGRWT